MRGRTILALSLGLNVGLGVGWYQAAKQHALKLTDTPTPPTATGTNRIRFVPLYHKQFFSWNEIESDDYEKYIANLRDIGCPEQTIRDLIVADVNQFYARKVAATNYTDVQLTDLETEQRELLTKLLGPDWETANLRAYQPTTPLVLDGPILGQLSDATKATVQEIAARAEAALQDYERKQHLAGQKADSAETARIEQAERTELAAILTPQQLDEFLRRFSPNANALRNQLGELKYFNATPAEFQNLFHATDALDLQLRALGDSTDVTVVQQRQAILQQREIAIKNALGPQRYAELARLADPAYRDALDAAQATGGSAQTVDAIYAINQAVNAQAAVVQANSNLTDIQKQIELKKIELAQLQAQGQLIGEVAPELPPLPQAVATVSTRPHVIQPGENLISLSFTYSAKASDIMAVNPGVSFPTLKPGDTINLPVIEPAPPTPAQ